MIQLNEGQQEAVDKMVKFLIEDTEKPFFTLSGAGGTGKTVSIKYAIEQAKIPHIFTSGATIAHSAKNVLSASLPQSIHCYTVAQWLGLRMNYELDGSITFKPDRLASKSLSMYKYAILDEASMINDELFDDIMGIISNRKIKLIVLGDVAQLPPVGQDHDSKFFDNIDAVLTEPMRFTGYITELGDVYRRAIKSINDGYAVSRNILNEETGREDRWDPISDTGYKFINNVYDLLDHAADQIKRNPEDINFARILAFKNRSVDIINTNIRDRIYGKNRNQFEHNEILISNGGYAYRNTPIIYNGSLFNVDDAVEIMGPYDIPCLSMKFKGFKPYNNYIIPVVDEIRGKEKYNEIKSKLFENAKRDPRQWIYYYKFVDSFAYFDYAYSVSTHKAQGQTLNNVYVLEGEIMDVKPLTLKQKYQALYVAMTRATDAVYVYNKNY